MQLQSYSVKLDATLPTSSQGLPGPSRRGNGRPRAAGWAARVQGKPRGRKQRLQGSSGPPGTLHALQSLYNTADVDPFLFLVSNLFPGPPDPFLVPESTAR